MDRFVREKVKRLQDVANEGLGFLYQADVSATCSHSSGFGFRSSANKYHFRKWDKQQGWVALCNKRIVLQDRGYRWAERLLCARCAGYFDRARQLRRDREEAQEDQTP